MELFQKVLPYIASGLAIFTIIVFYLDSKKDSRKKLAKK